MRTYTKAAEKVAIGKGLSNIAMRRTPITKNPTGMLCSDWEANNDLKICEEFKV